VKKGGFKRGDLGKLREVLKKKKAAPFSMKGKREVGRTWELLMEQVEESDEGIEGGEWTNNRSLKDRSALLGKRKGRCRKVEAKRCQNKEASNREGRIDSRYHLQSSLLKEKHIKRQRGRE